MAQGQKLPGNIMAVGDCLALFLDAQKLLTGCAFHTKLIHNTAQLLARKNIDLTLSMKHLSGRSTREKLLSYLNSMAQRHGGFSFTLLLNRQKLADTLCVNRIALCAVL